MINEYLSDKYDELIGNKPVEIHRPYNRNVPELNAMVADFADPLHMNFKFMINTNKPFGLFAPKSNINSAEAFLERVGEDLRCKLLVEWKKQFLTFIKDYEFLLMSIDGLGEIYAVKQGDAYIGSEITLTVRETIDMKLQSLLTTYRYIWFDDDRGCEVLPKNLRQFDIVVVTYASGYYDPAFYNDILPDMDSFAEQWQHLTSIDKYNFNSTMFYIANSELLVDKSGKSMFEDISNEHSGDMVKGGLVFEYKFATVTGNYANTFGKYTLANMFAIYSAIQKKQGFKGMMQQLAAKQIEEAADQANRLVDKVVNKPKKLLQKPIITNTFNKLESGMYIKQLRGVIEGSLDTVEQRYIQNKFGDLTRMLSDNFLMFDDLAGNNLGYRSEISSQAPNEPVAKNIKLRKTNGLVSPGF